MNRKFGAHEMMELHEVLTDTIDGINQFQLYRPHVQDQELLNILENQTRFMSQEYTTLVSMVSSQGMQGSVPQRSSMSQQGFSSSMSSFSPTYGLRNPAAETPNTSARMMDDRDVASCMLGFHKASANCRMHAALEIADPHIRNTIVQGAASCADQAYELFQFMNQKGYYQVPTLEQQTTQTMSGMYQPSSQMTVNMDNTQNMQGMQDWHQ